MKKYIKVISILLCLILLTGVVGCGKEAATSDIEGTIIGFEDEIASGVGVTSGDEGTSSASGTASGSVGTASNSGSSAVTGGDPFANIPKRLKGTTVTYAHFGDSNADEHVQLAKFFEKKTGIKLVWKSYNQAEYVSQVAKQIAGGASPDVVLCNDVFPYALEICQPLQDYIDLSDDFWDDTITQYSTINGNTYLVNSLNSVQENIDMVFYNKKLFSTNGLTTPTDYWKSGKWTYENLKKCLEEVVKTGNIGGYVDAKKINTGLGIPMIEYDAKNSKFFTNIDSTASAYQFVAQINKEGLWSTTAWWGTFASGNIGIYVSGLWGAKYNGYFKDINPADLAAVPMPTSFQGKECLPTGSFRGQGIAKGAKNPEGAAYFLRYYLDYKNWEDNNFGVFMNEDLRKTYFDVIVPEVKKRGINISFENLYADTINSSHDATFPNITRADPAQVPTILASGKNVVQNVIAKANQELATYK